MNRIGVCQFFNNIIDCTAKLIIQIHMIKLFLKLFAYIFSNNHYFLFDFFLNFFFWFFNVLYHQFWIGLSSKSLSIDLMLNLLSGILFLKLIDIFFYDTTLDFTNFIIKNF